MKACTHQQKNDPAPLAVIVLLKVKVVHGPPTLLLGEVAEELGGSQRALLLDNDLRVVLGEWEDDLPSLPPECQLLVHIETLDVHADAERLCSVE